MTTLQYRTGVQMDLTYSYTTAVPLNYTCSTHHDFLPPTHSATYFFEAYVAIPIFILGIITNTLTFVVIGRMTLGKVFKMLLRLLGLTDLCACVVGLISQTMEIVIFHGEMPFGHMCPGVVETYSFFFAFMMFLSMSHTMVIVISSIRVYTMLKPFESRALLKKSKVARIVIVLYIIIFFLFLPVGFYILWQSCFDDIHQVPFCRDLFQQFPKLRISKHYVSFLSLIFGPVVVVANLVSLVLLRKAMHKAAVEGERLQYRSDSENHIGSTTRKTERVTRVLFYVLVVNTICITPLIIQTALLELNSRTLVFSKDNLVWALFDVIAETMLQVIPSYNFWTYIIINKDFRRKLRQTVFRQEVEDDSTEMTRRFHSRNNSQASLHRLKT